MKILVAEDDYVSRRLLMKLLEGWGEVDFAVDGTEALGKFRGARKLNEPYALLCLDIMMPGMDGREVLREIRTIEEEEGISAINGVKIMMVTALSAYDNIAQAFRDQCDGYVTKPLNAEKLDSTLATLGFERAGK